MKYNRTFIRLEKIKTVDIICSGPTSQYLTMGINFITFGVDIQTTAICVLKYVCGPIAIHT
jgi:hypothetical protein